MSNDKTKCCLVAVLPEGLIENLTAGDNNGKSYVDFTVCGFSCRATGGYLVDLITDLYKSEFRCQVVCRGYSHKHYINLYVDTVRRSLYE